MGSNDDALQVGDRWRQIGVGSARLTHPVQKQRVLNARRTHRPTGTIGRVMREALIARRRALGYTQQSLAHEVGAAQTTVARWERGETDVSAHHREPLASALQWSMTELDTALNGNSSLPVASGGWWSNYVTLEQSATSVRSYEPVLVPGLLQTRDYAAALLGDNDLVIRRMDRQRMLTRPTNPADLVAIIDESVLLRPIGGSKVLADQLQHLATMTERSNISVQVLPLDAQAQPVYWGSLVIVRFPWSGGLVYLEHQEGAHYLDSLHDIEAHTRVFDQLRELAFSPPESLDRIQRAARELET